MAEADFIVVGAGTAGCVLANRLSQSNRVLLVEAGKKPGNPFVSIPAGFSRLFRSEVDWALLSEPQLHRQRRIFTPRGRMLGGSSNLNAQIFQWCQPRDFEDWAASGAVGWGWSAVAPAFLEQESWAGPDSGRARGRTGPLRVAPNRNLNALSRAFVEAARACIPHNSKDYNGGPFEGAWPVQLSHHGGKRFSAYDAYLKPVRGRQTLSVVTDALVSGLVWEGRACRGVTVAGGLGTRTLRARRGVILAAGAIGSPHLLMLSGVGPAAQLSANGVGVVHDAPGVGSGLQDHPTVPIGFGTTRRDTLMTADSLPNLLRYLLFRTGPLASNAIEAFSFSTVGEGEPAPDLELLFAPLEWRDQGLEKPAAHGFTIAPAVVKPRSRGAVTLAGPDPRVAPRIDFRLLSDEGGRDRQVMAAGIELARKIAATAPLAAETTRELSPGPDCVSGRGLDDFIAETIQTVYHPTSTCRMGVDDGAPVSPELSVKGTDGLWVADAAVMPSVPSGHPDAVVAMIANRAAAFISQT